MIGMRFEGVVELARTLRALPDRVSTKVLRAALEEAAEPMRDSMATTVHRAPGRPDIADHMIVKGVNRYEDVDLGVVVVEPGSAAVTVGPAKGYFWGSFLEFGTPRARPFPFMRPAFDQHAAGALSDLAASIWRALAGAGQIRTGTGSGPVSGGSGGSTL